LAQGIGKEAQSSTPSTIKNNFLFVIFLYIKKTAVLFESDDGTSGNDHHCQLYMSNKQSMSKTCTPLHIQKLFLKKILYKELQCSSLIRCPQM
jgi:hypothetical protein